MSVDQGSQSGGVASGHQTGPIDDLMERASRALAETRYFEAASAARRALDRARDAEDFDAMARICLPLQEARRQIRQLAVDAHAGRDAPSIRLILNPEDVPRPLAAGCYLLQPPMIGADARTLRVSAERRKTPVLVLTREPLTRNGQWPIVGVGPVSARAKVDPPFPMERVEDRMCKDGYQGEPPIPLSWFEAAGEALGDAAIATVTADRHPWWRVDDLLEFLDAVPEHEKLHQALAQACRDADGHDGPGDLRRPSPFDSPFSF